MRWREVIAVESVISSEPGELLVRDTLLRDTYVKIDLCAISHNMSSIKAMAGEGVDVMAVIKADGYGHGSVRISRTLMESGASCLAVATLSEALELKFHYSDYPIFILGHTPDRLLVLAVKNDIITSSFITLAGMNFSF